VFVWHGAFAAWRDAQAELAHQRSKLLAEKAGMEAKMEAARAGLEKERAALAIELRHKRAVMEAKMGEQGALMSDAIARQRAELEGAHERVLRRMLVEERRHWAARNIVKALRDSLAGSKPSCATVFLQWLCTWLQHKQKGAAAPAAPAPSTPATADYISRQLMARVSPRCQAGLLGAMTAVMRRWDLRSLSLCILVWQMQYEKYQALWELEAANTEEYQWQVGHVKQKAILRHLVHAIDQRLILDLSFALLRWEGFVAFRKGRPPKDPSYGTELATNQFAMPQFAAPPSPSSRSRSSSQLASQAIAESRSMRVEEWAERARAAKQEGDLQQALQWFGRAIELAPEDHVLLGQRASVHLQLGSMAPYQADMKRCLTLDSAFAGMSDSVLSSIVTAAAAATLHTKKSSLATRLGGGMAPF